MCKLWLYIFIDVLRVQSRGNRKSRSLKTELSQDQREHRSFQDKDAINLFKKREREGGRKALQFLPLASADKFYHVFVSRNQWIYSPTEDQLLPSLLPQLYIGMPLSEAASDHISDQYICRYWVPAEGNKESRGLCMVELTYKSLYWSKALLASTSSLRRRADGMAPSSRGGSYLLLHGDLPRRWEKQRELDNRETTKCQKFVGQTWSTGRGHWLLKLHSVTRDHSLSSCFYCIKKTCLGLNLFLLKFSKVKVKASVVTQDI